MLTVAMNAWIGLLLAIIMGIGIAGIGMGTMHDAVHGSYSQKEWVNKMLGGTLYLLGSYVLNWKIQHNILHHTYTNIDGRDEDIASRGPIRLSEHALLRKIHRYQYIHAFFSYGLMTFSKLVKDFKQFKSMALLELSETCASINVTLSPVFNVNLATASLSFISIGMLVIRRSDVFDFPSPMNNISFSLTLLIE